MGEKLEPHRRVEKHPDWLVSDEDIRELRQRMVDSRVEEKPDEG